MKKIKLFFPLLLTIVLLASCSKDDDSTPSIHREKMKAVIEYTTDSIQRDIPIQVSASVSAYITENIEHTVPIISEFDTERFYSIYNNDFKVQNPYTLHTKIPVEYMYFSLGFDIFEPSPKQKLHIKVYSGGELVDERTVKSWEHKTGKYIKFRVKAQ